MARFFIDPQDMHSDFIVLTGDNANHARVLRIRNGEEVTVCDGNGRQCQCVVSDVSTDQISLVVKKELSAQAEPSIDVSVYMAFSKGDKFEHVVQKATELGATEIIAFPSARCVSRPDDKSLKKKLERWQKIAESAAEQSGRAMIPRVLVSESYESALKRASQAELPILFYENEQATTLHMAISSSPFQSVSLLTGPEGGLEEREVSLAREYGLRVCTLGKRILRCETAPLCALSAVMYAAGEF